MGCGTSVRLSTSSSQPVPSIAKNGTSSPPARETAQANLKPFTLLLFALDSCPPDLKPRFGSVATANTVAELLPALAKLATPVVLAVTEGRYSEIAAAAEETGGKLAAIVLIGAKASISSPSTTARVLGTVTAAERICDLLSGFATEYSRAQRFFDDRTEKSFYGLEDKNLIVGSLRMRARSDEFSIFYPLGMKAVGIKGVLSDRLLDSIVEAAQKESSVGITTRVADIAATVAFLKVHGTEMKSIIESYTMQGLYFMLNLYLRYGTHDGLSLFKEYMFCLKGSMCELGKPMTEKGMITYRGLRWDPKFLEEYRRKKGQCVLLNGFVSTSLDKKVALEFAKKGSGVGTSTVLEMKLVECDESYVRFVRDFEFPEENGVYFPVDVSEFSIYAGEKEVLFPPFYPVKIVDVGDETVDGRTYSRILAEVPNCVNISGKNRLNNILKAQTSDVDWGKEYLDSMLRLSSRRIVDKLSLVNLNLSRYASEFQRVLGLVKEGLCRQLMIEHESLSQPELSQIADSSVLGRLQRLSLNNNGIGPASEAILSRLLKDNTALAALELADNNLPSESIREIANFVRSNGTLTELVLSGNRVEGEAGLALAGAMEENRGLASLDLSSCEMKKEIAMRLGEALEKNTTLYSLNVCLNSLDDITMKDFGKAVTRNRTLVALYYQQWEDRTYQSEKFRYLTYLNNIFMSQQCAKKDSAIVPAERKYLVEKALQRDIDLSKIDMRVAYESAARNVEKIACILKTNEIVTEVNLEHSLVKGENVGDILAALAGDRKLRSLNLSRNALSEAETRGVAGLLKSADSALCELKLSDCSVSAAAGVIIMEAIHANKRLRRLDLSCNKLDETIGPGMRTALEGNSALDWLDLTKNPLGDESGIQIAAALLKNRALTVLKLNSTGLGTESIRALGEAVRTSRTLKKLCITYCPPGYGELFSSGNTLTQLCITADVEIDPESKRKFTDFVSSSKTLESLHFSNKTVAKSVLEALRDATRNGATLKTLKFSDLELGLEPEKLSLVAEIIKHCGSLTHLYFRAVFKEAGELRLLAAELRVTRTIRALSLRGSKLDEKGAKVVSEILMGNTSIATLNLRSCNIDDMGVSRLALALQRNRTLTTLYIDQNPHITDRTTIISSLMRNFTLTTLYMDGPVWIDVRYLIVFAAYANRTLSKVITPDGVNHLMALRDAYKEQMKASKRNKAVAMIQDCMKKGSKVEGLVLAESYIDVDLMQSLTEGLKHNNNIVELFLGSNGNGDACARLIADMLMVNTTIVALTFTANGATEEAAKAFAEVLKRNKTLNVFRLCMENVGDGGAKALAQAMKVNLTLRTFSVICCNVGDEGATALAEAFKENAKAEGMLKEANMKNNMISDEGSMSLMRAAEACERLEVHLRGNIFGDEMLDKLKKSPASTRMFL